MPLKPRASAEQEEAKKQAESAASAAAARRSGKGKKAGKEQFKMYAVIAVGVAMALLAAFLAVSPNPPKKGSGAAAKMDNLVNDGYFIPDVTSAAEGNFTAAAAPFFNAWTLRHAKYGLDGIHTSPQFLGMSGAVQVCEGDEGLEGGAIPPAYDARENHESCFPKAYDSGNCSASYAIAAAEVLASRFCISDSTKYSGLRLSPQQILSCDKKSRGCKGGGIDSVWAYIQRRGLYPEECVPYVGEAGAACKSECGEEKKLKVLEHCILTKEKAVKREIYNRGPVVAPLYIKTEYLVYGAGVYTPTETAETLFDDAGDAIMAAVSVVGWGKSQGTPYWIVKHSWGSTWGEDGYARVSMNSIVNNNYVVVAVPATEEALAAAEVKKQEAEARKEEAKKERAARDERIAEARAKYEAEKAAQKDAADDKELDDDDDFEAEVDLDADDAPTAE